MARTIHIIGAGLAGLSAALKLSGRGDRVVVHEATAFAGGRCRSFHDATLGMTIDNGNHLLLSGNHAAMDFLNDVGGADKLIGPAHAEFNFVDLKSRERWTLRFNDGRLPFWIFDKSRRVPGTRVLDYLALAKLLRPAPGETVGEVIACKGVLYKRLVEPLLLAALNIDPPLGAARLASAIVRETLGAGGLACRPLIAREGLGPNSSRAGAGDAGAARCGSASGTSIARNSFCRCPRGGARFRQRERNARHGRRCCACRAALYCPSLVDGLEVRRISRHRQRAFSD